jgi:hypothetical protein
MKVVTTSSIGQQHPSPASLEKESIERSGTSNTPQRFNLEHRILKSIVPLVDFRLGRRLFGYMSTMTVVPTIKKIPLGLLENKESLDERKGSLNYSTESPGVYTLEHHADYLRLHQQQIKGAGFCWYCDVSLMFPDTVPTSNVVKDYVSPVPLDELQKLYFGLERSVVSSSEILQHFTAEQLPVRTLVFRIHPDCNCGVVMNAVQTAFEKETQSIVLKRQGGHFQGLVDHPASAPYLVDAQLCTERSETMERQLVVRIFHPQTENGDVGTSSTVDESSIPLNLHLKQASSFLQHLRLVEGQTSLFSKVDAELHLGDMIPKHATTPKEMAKYLMSHYRPCPSINISSERGTSLQLLLSRRDHGSIFLPALSSNDWPVMQSSWTTCLRVWNELTEQGCSFSNVAEMPLGANFLDAQYCSQIRQLSRDSMLEQFQPTNKTLQATAQLAEDTYSNFFDLVDSACSRYNLGRPALLPASVGSRMRVPSRACPTGFTIMAAMACYFAQASVQDPVEQADDAVKRVFTAFVLQDDLEKSKYFKGKNAELKERRSQLEYHQRMLLRCVEDRDSPETNQAAHEFCQLAQQATNKKGRVSRHQARTHFPLVQIPLISTAPGGMCYITRTLILCKSNGLFPQIFLFDLRKVDLQIHDQTISIDINGERVYRFRPEMDPTRLKLFVDTLRTLHRSRTTATVTLTRKVSGKDQSFFLEQSIC